jgi:hypothetical protein
VNRIRDSLVRRSLVRLWGESPVTSKLLLLIACVAAIVILPHTVEFARAGWSIHNDLAIAATATFGTMRAPEERHLMGIRLISTGGLPTDELGLMVVLSDRCGSCDRALEFWRTRAGEITNGRAVWFVAIGDHVRGKAVDACQSARRSCRVYSVEDIEAFHLSSGIGIVPASVVAGKSTACAILGSPSAAGVESCRTLLAGPSLRSNRPPIVWGEGGQQLAQQAAQ